MIDLDLSPGWYDDGSGPRRWWDDRHWPGSDLDLDLDLNLSFPDHDDEMMLTPVGWPEARRVAILLAIVGLILIGFVIALAQRTDHPQGDAQAPAASLRVPAH
jgi:hypothetical protein